MARVKNAVNSRKKRNTTLERARATVASARACTARLRSRSHTRSYTTTATARSARTSSANSGFSASTPLHPKRHGLLALHAGTQACWRRG